MVELRIDGSEHRYILVKVLRRSHPSAMDYWDGNWLAVRIEARIGAWSGCYDASLRIEDFIAFREEIEKLQAGRVQEARFASMEGQLNLTLYIDYRGQFVIDGDARDVAGYGNQLQFKEWDVAQEEPDQIVRQLTEIANAFPLCGKPDE